MAEKVLMKGNEAIAEAAIRCGCRFYLGYPITPQTEIAAYMAKRMPKVGGTFLQAESEIAAINMVIGVASTGKRVMTSSSSPGISLKGEGISYLAGCDLPAVVVNIQRGGPGLGSIQSSQADYLQSTKGGGHGDYHNIVVAPATIQEMVDLTRKSFYLADKYRMVAMVLGDGTLGQMMEPVTIEDIDEEPIAKPWAVTGTNNERVHNVVNSFYLESEDCERMNYIRYEKYAEVEKNEIMYEEYMVDDADICIVSYGITSRISKTAILEARKMGIKVGLVRPITLWPFPKAPILKAAQHCKAFLSVELSMGQMIDDIRLASECTRPVYLCNRVGGIVLNTDEVLAKIIEVNEKVGDR